MTPLHWIDGITPLRLAVSARPRGGDWLESELLAWQAEGVATVVSLLEPEEERELELQAEGSIAGRIGLAFLSFPIPDLGVPASAKAAFGLIGVLEEHLHTGRPVAIHSQAGSGTGGHNGSRAVDVVEFPAGRGHSDGLGGTRGDGA